MYSVLCLVILVHLLGEGDLDEGEGTEDVPEGSARAGYHLHLRQMEKDTTHDLLIRQVRQICRTERSKAMVSLTEPVVFVRRRGEGDEG